MSKRRSRKELVITAPVIQNSPLLNLPGNVLEKILLYLTYGEITRLRLVCYSLHDSCDAVLHVAFQTLGGKLHRLIRQVSTGPRRESNKYQSKLTVLCNAFVEYRFLRAVLWRYMSRLTFTFIPGIILDQFYFIIYLCGLKIGSISLRRILTDQTKILTNTVEKFYKYFQAHIEPTVKSERIQIGVKVIDLLDCSLGGSCLLQLTYSRTACKVSGKYLCPISAICSTCQDNRPVSAYSVPDVEIHIWLAELREIIRQSNSGYIREKIRSLDENGLNMNALFHGIRHSLGRTVSWDRECYRESFHKTLDSCENTNFGSVWLHIQINSQFPLWQWPLEMEPLCVFLEKPSLHDEDIDIAKRFDMHENTGYFDSFSGIGKRSHISNILREQDKKVFMLRVEVCKSATEEKESSRPRINYPIMKRDGLKRILKLYSDQFTGFEGSNYANFTPELEFRNCRVTYDIAESTGDDKYEVIFGQMISPPVPLTDTNIPESTTESEHAENVMNEERKGRKLIRRWQK